MHSVPRNRTVQRSHVACARSTCAPNYQRLRYNRAASAPLGKIRVRVEIAQTLTEQRTKNPSSVGCVYIVLFGPGHAIESACCRCPTAVTFFYGVHGADPKHSRMRPVILPAPARQISVSLYKLQASRKVIAERQRHRDGCALTARLDGRTWRTDGRGRRRQRLLSAPRISAQRRAFTGTPAASAAYSYV